MKPARERLAEHANSPGLDVQRVLKMLILRDLEGNDAGDTFAHEYAGQPKPRLMEFLG